MGRPAGRLSCFAVVFAAALTGLARPVPGEGTAPAHSDPVPVPSGEPVYWVETISDTQGPGGLTLRFRFLAPGIGSGSNVTPEIAQSDMQALCDTFALPRLTTMGPIPGQIVISLSDRAVAFGDPDGDAVQYFEAYSVADGACVWELF